MSCLSPSLGKEMQDLQITQANYEKEDEGMLAGSREKMDCGSDHREPSPAMTGIVIYSFLHCEGTLHILQWLCVVSGIQIDITTISFTVSESYIATNIH